MKQVTVNGFGRISQLFNKNMIAIDIDDIERFKLKKPQIRFSNPSLHKDGSLGDVVSGLFGKKINRRDLDLLSESFTDSYFERHHYDFKWLSTSTNICETSGAVYKKEAVPYSTSFRHDSNLEEKISSQHKVLVDNIKPGFNPISQNELLRFLPASVVESIISIEQQPIDFNRIKKDLKKIYAINRSQVKNIFKRVLKRVLKGIKTKIKKPQVHDLIAQIIPPRLFHNYIDDTDNNRVAIHNFSLSCSYI